MAMEETAASSTSASPTRVAGQEQGGHHQRRLWVKNRSGTWWDRCNSTDFLEEEFRHAFRKGQEMFVMICDALGSSVAKEDTMLRATIPVHHCVAICICRMVTRELLRLWSDKATVARFKESFEGSSAVASVDFALELAAGSRGPLQVTNLAAAILNGCLQLLTQRLRLVQTTPSSSSLRMAGSSYQAPYI